MIAHVNIGSGASLHLDRALLVYGRRGYASGDSGAGAYVTVHDVHHPDDGPPTLGAGRPADLALIRALAESAQAAVPPEVFPPHVLARTADVTCWWSEEGLRPIFFREGSKLGGLTGRVLPQPALVWKIEGRSLYVRALAESARPGPDTPLFRAPYWNTDLDGRVCLGDMKRPGRAGLDTLRAWEDGFFGSLFTGQNQRGAYTKATGGVVGLWRDSVARLSKEPRRFPVRHLEPVSQTMAAFVTGGGHRG